MEEITFGMLSVPDESQWHVVKIITLIIILNESKNYVFQKKIHLCIHSFNIYSVVDLLGSRPRYQGKSNCSRTFIVRYTAVMGIFDDICLIRISKG